MAMITPPWFHLWIQQQDSGKCSFRPYNKWLKKSKTNFPGWLNSRREKVYPTKRSAWKYLWTSCPPLGYVPESRAKAGSGSAPRLPCDCCMTHCKTPTSQGHFSSKLKVLCKSLQTEPIRGGWGGTGGMKGFCTRRMFQKAVGSPWTRILQMPIHPNVLAQPWSSWQKRRKGRWGLCHISRLVAFLPAKMRGVKVIITLEKRDTICWLAAMKGHFSVQEPAGCLARSPEGATGDRPANHQMAKPVVEAINSCLHKQFALIIRYWIQHTDVLCLWHKVQSSILSPPWKLALGTFSVERNGITSPLISFLCFSILHFI